MKPLKQRKTLTSDVYEQLKELIIAGRVMPGEQISLRPTAEILNVSMMPVREATQRLIAEQALEIMPNRVVRVPILTKRQFSEITQIRILIESLAVCEATHKISHTILNNITKIAQQFSDEMNSKTPDGIRLINLNKELHFTIYKEAQMPVLLYLIETLWLRIGPVLNYDLQKHYRKTENKVAVDNHHKLVVALKEGNEILAQAALRSDIESAAEYILSTDALLSDD